MSIIKALIITPRPCPFCGGSELELRALIFRQWNMHCLNSQCRCKGPDGKTPDMAVAKWNHLHKNCLNERQNLSTMQKDYQNPEIIQKIWKAVRALRTFTSSEVTRITECNSQTVSKYLYLLEKNDFLRIEGQKHSPGAPNVYRCIRSKVVEPPSWIRLQLSDRELEEYRMERKSLKWNKVKATNA